MTPPTDKLLFTPGPLTTSNAVKEAMLRDLGSRDADFVAVVGEIRQLLLALAGVRQAEGYEAILMQGAGTFGIESVISSVIPADGKLLIIINGAYGKRIREIAGRHGIETAAEVITFCREYAKFSDRVPLVVVPSTYSQTTEDELAKAGVSIVIYANQLLRSAYPAMVNVAESILRHGRASEAEDLCMPIKDIINLIPERS